MARISPQIRQEILEKTDYLSIYQEHVHLQKKGSSYWGLCPFHSEKTPSFSVSPDTGLFYCFGCHKGGSVVQFLMEIEKFTYTEAMEELAQRCGMRIQFESGEEHSESEKEREAMLDLYERLSNTFHWFLVANEVGQTPLQCCIVEGFPIRLIERFRIGYALFK